MTRRGKYVMLALLAGAAWVATRDLIQGMRIETARAVLDSSVREGRDRLLADWESRASGNPLESVDTSPPEALALAALWIDQAAGAPPPLRRRALSQADNLLAHVRAIRPAAPSTTLLEVRADLIRFGRPRTATLFAFARSYRQAGFLRDEGLWRIAFAALYWRDLSESTRKSVVDEALWLARLDGRLRVMVNKLVTGTPLALPVGLRLMS